MNLSLSLWEKFWDTMYNFNPLLCDTNTPQGQKSFSISEETAFSPFSSKQQKDREHQSETELNEDKNFNRKSTSRLLFVNCNYPLLAPIMVITDDSPHVDNDSQLTESFRSLVSWAESIKNTKGHPQPKLGLFYEVSSQSKITTNISNDLNKRSFSDMKIYKKEDKGTQVPEKAKKRQKQKMNFLHHVNSLTKYKNYPRDSVPAYNANNFLRIIPENSESLIETLNKSSELSFTDHFHELYQNQCNIVKPKTIRAVSTNYTDSLDGSALSISKSPSLSPLMFLFTNLIVSENESSQFNCREKSCTLSETNADILIKRLEKNSKYLLLSYQNSSIKGDLTPASEKSTLSMQTLTPKYSSESSIDFNVQKRKDALTNPLTQWKKNADRSEEGLFSSVNEIQNLNKSKANKDNLVMNSSTSSQLRRNSLCSSGIMNTFLEIVEKTVDTQIDTKSDDVLNMSKNANSKVLKFQNNLRKIMSELVPEKQFNRAKLRQKLLHPIQNCETSISKQEKTSISTDENMKSNTKSLIKTDLQSKSKEVNISKNKCKEPIAVDANKSHHEKILECRSIKILERRCSHIDPQMNDLVINTANDSFHDSFKSSEKYKNDTTSTFCKESSCNCIHNLRECLPSCCSFTEFNPFACHAIYKSIHSQNISSGAAIREFNPQNISQPSPIFLATQTDLQTQPVTIVLQETHNTPRNIFRNCSCSGGLPPENANF